MNFYDFMIFITRFTLGNVIQLFHLRHGEAFINSSPTKSCRFITNLISIRAVASKLKCLEAFAEENLISCSVENLTAFSDVHKIMEEQEFHDLCCALKSTYDSEDEKWEKDSQSNTMLFCRGCCECLNADSDLFRSVISLDSKIRGPEELVNLIDRVMEETNSSNCSITFPCDVEHLVV